MTPCAKLTKIHQKAAPRERLGWYLQKTGEVFEHRENLLRLLVVMVMSNEAAEPEPCRQLSKCATKVATTCGQGAPGTGVSGM